MKRLVKAIVVLMSVIILSSCLEKAKEERKGSFESEAEDASEQLVKQSFSWASDPSAIFYAPEVIEHKGNFYLVHVSFEGPSTLGMTEYHCLVVVKIDPARPDRYSYNKENAISLIIGFTPTKDDINRAKSENGWPE